MAEMTPEQMEALVRAGGGGSGAVGWEPLRSGLDAALAYRTPMYRTPTQADLERAERLQELRIAAAEALAARTNEATKIQFDAQGNMADALAAMADAHAKNNQANAQVQQQFLEAYGKLSADVEALAQRTRYLAVDAPEATQTSATQMSGAVTGAVTEAGAATDPAAWSAQGDRLAQTLADSARVAYDAQTTTGGKAGAFRATSLDAQRAAAAYASRSGLPQEQQAALAQQVYASYQQNLANAGVKPDASELTRINEKAEQDTRETRDVLIKNAKQYGLPADLTQGVLQIYDTYARWNDPSNPNAMNQMVMASSDLATEALRQSVAQLDVEIERATATQGDPFYESLGEFAKNHPWYDTWRRASGIRNHEEAMRWIVAHAEGDNGDLVRRMDRLWEETLDANAGKPPDVATMRDMLQGERQQRQDQVRLARQEGGEGVQPTMRGYQNSRLGRAAAEVADLFRPTTGINPIPGGMDATSTPREAAARTPNYNAYTTTMEEAGRPDYKGKHGGGPTSPRGYPREPAYQPPPAPRPDPAAGVGAGTGGAGGADAGGPQQGQVGARERVERRLREVGRPYRPSDLLDEQARRLA